jgi:uncharacterized protein YjbJ (UPF0337 family)
MSWNRLGGVWAQIKGQAKQHWGKLPEDDFHEVERRRDRLARLFQERHGMEREEAERQIDQWIAPCGGPAGMTRTA